MDFVAKYTDYTSMIFLITATLLITVNNNAQPPAPPTPEDIVLLREIRDSLKK